MRSLQKKYRSSKDILHNYRLTKGSYIQRYTIYLSCIDASNTVIYYDNDVLIYIVASCAVVNMVAGSNFFVFNYVMFCYSDLETKLVSTQKDLKTLKLKQR